MILSICADKGNNDFIRSIAKLQLQFSMLISICIVYVVIIRKYIGIYPPDSFMLHYLFNKWINSVVKFNIK